MGGYKVASDSVSRICFFFFLNNTNKVLFWNYFHLVLTKHMGKNPSINSRFHHDQDKRNKPVTYFKISVQELLSLLSLNEVSTMNSP